MKHTQRNWLAVATLALALPIYAFADTSGTKTLSASTNLNLDTGNTASGAGGDILWSGSTITPQGSAKAFNVGPAGSLTGITKSLLDGFKALASSAAIPSSTLVVGDLFAVFTNGGNTAAVLVTTNGNGSITLQFTTFGASSGGGGGGPIITKVQNNSSSIPAGFPNSGIAPSSLFKIRGSGLSDNVDVNNHSSEGAGLSTTLNGASITVTVGSTTVHPAMYYAGPFDPDTSSPMQLSAVLPAATPLGTATVVVTYKGVASNSFQIQVVEAAPGITTYNNGTGVAQDVTRLGDSVAGLVTFTKSIAPGGVILLWGTGLGATSKDYDTTYNATQLQTSIPYAIYIGGVQVTNIIYKGATVYPGVSVFGLTVPSNVPTGCYVPIVAVATTAAGPVVSNTATLPIAVGSGTCSDPQLGIAGDQVSTLSGKTTVNTGTVIVVQGTAPGTGGAPTTSNTAVAVFQQVAGSNFAGGSTVSIGGCILIQSVTGGSTTLPTGLNAGTITVTGPGGSPVTLTAFAQFPGLYSATLSSIPSTGGAYVFNGTAGSQVGGFTTTVTFPNPILSWTNQSAAATVNRSQGLTVNWTGGSSGTYVTITGTSVSGTASGSYTCIAPQAAGTFTVPNYILLGMPAGTGTTSVQNSTNFTTFSASGLDFGLALGSESFSVNSNVI